MSDREAFLAAVSPTLESRIRERFVRSLMLRQAALPYVGGYLAIDNARGVEIEGVRVDGSGDFVLWGRALREGREVAISGGPENGWPLIVRDAPVDRWPDRMALVRSILADLPGLR